MLERCLRTLNVRYFRHQRKIRDQNYVPTIEQALADREGGEAPAVNERYVVRCIYTTLHQIVIAVNGQIKSWDLDPGRQLARWSEGGKKKKARIKRRLTGLQTVSKTERNLELKKDLEDSNRALERERHSRDSRNSKSAIKKPISMGLSEEELVHYVMMLSLQTSPGLLASALPLPPPFELDRPLASSSRHPNVFIPFAENFSYTESEFRPISLNEDSFPPLAKVSPSPTSIRSPRPPLPPADASGTFRTEPIAISSPSKHPMDKQGRRNSKGKNSMESSFTSPKSSRSWKMSWNEFAASTSLPDEGTADGNTLPAFPLPSPSGGSLGSKPSWQSNSIPVDPENSDEHDETEEDDEDALFSDLHGRRRDYRNRSSSDAYNTIQTVPRDTAAVDDELQYALELSLIEQ